MSSPPPGAGEVDPMGVARRFVKRYYQTLTTEPDRILNFYGDASFMSHGDGNMPVEPLTLKDLETKHLTERFFRFGEEVSFELENGSIDAQVSVNEGVLIVVTGHMLIDDGSRRRRFCQTFFLNPQANGSKKNYYVHNDVLRFLHEDKVDQHQEEQAAAVATPTESSVDTGGEPQQIAEETAASEQQQPIEKATTTEAIEEAVVVSPPTPVEPEPEVTVEENKSADEDDDEAVEESKIDPDDVVEQAEQKPTNNGEAASATTSSPKPTLPPGSWASLVASTASTPPPTPTRAPAPTKKKNSIQKQNDKQTETATTSDKSATPPSLPDKALDSSSHRNSERKANNNDHPHQRQNQQPRRVKRDPDCTLVIKGCPDGTKETDIRAVFERFATQTNTDILGITVSSHRGLAFVDYNSPDPVMAALKEHKANGFVLKDANVNVAQKTQDNKRRERDGKGGGRHSYKNRDHYEHRHHRRDGGRGGRGGGRGGRGRGGGSSSNTGGGDGGGGGK